MALKGNNDSLFVLIKSLNKTEKAYFKKFASRHKLSKKNKYILLFDEIAGNTDEYDEKKIKKKLSREKFVKNFSVMKKYLYKMILNSLGNYYSEVISDLGIKNEVKYIEILYRKNLFKNCISIIEKALKQSYTRNNFQVVLELLKWKKNLILEGIYKENEFIMLENVYQEEQEVINMLKNLSDYRRLSYKTRSLVLNTNPYHRGAAVKKELENILNHPLLKSEKEALSYPALVNYWHILGTVYETLSMNLEAFNCRKKLIGEMENHPSALKENITNYIVIISDLISSSLNLKLNSELEYYFRKLRNLDKTYSGNISKHDRMLIFVGSTIFDLKMHIKRGNFKALVSKLSGIEKGLKDFENMIAKPDVLYYYYMLAYAYYGAGNTDKALEWINKILSDNEFIKGNSIFVKTKIMNLIIHYELGNYDLLDYLLKSAFRQLKNLKTVSLYEQTVLNFLKEINIVSSKSNIKSLISESLEKLKAYKGTFPDKFSRGKLSPNSESRFSYFEEPEFDYISWFKSIFSGKSFEDTVKSKQFI